MLRQESDSGDDLCHLRYRSGFAPTRWSVLDPDTSLYGSLLLLWSVHAYSLPSGTIEPRQIDNRCSHLAPLAQVRHSDRIADELCPHRVVAGKRQTLQKRGVKLSRAVWRSVGLMKIARSFSIFAAAGSDKGAHLALSRAAWQEVRARCVEKHFQERSAELQIPSTSLRAGSARS